MSADMAWADNGEPVMKGAFLQRFCDKAFSSAQAARLT